jgi:hypothetical protein
MKNIALLDIEEDKKKLEIVGYFKEFIMVLLYKAKKILPFKDQLLTRITVVFPNKFELQKLIDLAKDYTNIISEEEFCVFHDELKIWSSNIENLSQLYVQKYSEDIQAFYCDKEIL